jgi:hypothetical protein
MYEYRVPINYPVIGKYQGLFVFPSELMGESFTYMYDPSLQASQVTEKLNKLHKSKAPLKRTSL